MRTSKQRLMALAGVAIATSVNIWATTAWFTDANLVVNEVVQLPATAGDFPDGIGPWEKIGFPEGYPTPPGGMALDPTTQNEQEEAAAILKKQLADQIAAIDKLKPMAVKVRDLAGGLSKSANDGITMEMPNLKRRIQLSTLGQAKKDELIGIVDKAIADLKNAKTKSDSGKMNGEKAVNGYTSARALLVECQGHLARKEVAGKQKHEKAVATSKAALAADNAAIKESKEAAALVQAAINKYDSVIKQLP